MDKPSCCSPAPDAAPVVLETKRLSVRAGERLLLREVNLRISARQVFGIIGPSGAGKSTLLKCLNRLTDLAPNLKVTGDVLYQGNSIYTGNVDVDHVRARIGMLFQQPVVFPQSIVQNVLFGARHLRPLSRREKHELAERALGEAALWHEVKDRLNEPALRLSVGQQQRLCLARALAVDPEIILMDEPTSALDPKSTDAIEELIHRLKELRTIVLVTHNIAQARRVTDWLACVCVRDGGGIVAETACCDTMLTSPQCREVAEYLEHAAP